MPLNDPSTWETIVSQKSLGAMRLSFLSAMVRVLHDYRNHRTMSWLLRIICVAPFVGYLCHILLVDLDLHPVFYNGAIIIAGFGADKLLGGALRIITEFAEDPIKFIKSIRKK